MKVVIEFNLPEDQEELESYQNHQLYARFYRDLYNEVFRPVIKYSQNQTEAEYFELVWSKVCGYIRELEK